MSQNIFESFKVDALFLWSLWPANGRECVHYLQETHEERLGQKVNIFTNAMKSLIKLFLA